jgi:hypothetical protein
VVVGRRDTDRHRSVPLKAEGWLLQPRREDLRRDVRPKPEDVATKMVRVTRPSDRIVMSNWIPNDPTFLAQIRKISSAYSPHHRAVTKRFAAAGVSPENISFQRETYTFDFPV